MFKTLRKAFGLTVEAVKSAFRNGQRGAIDVMSLVYGLIMVVVGAVVLGKAIPALWPTLIGSGAEIASLTDTSAPTEVLQSFWPVVLIVIGIGVAAGAIFWALRHFKFGH